MLQLLAGIFLRAAAGNLVYKPCLFQGPGTGMSWEITIQIKA